MITVDFFTNCWERDYREVLGTNLVQIKAAQFRYPFRNVCVTINNVNDIMDARKLAEQAIHNGYIDRAIFVEDALPGALKTCGLKDAQLGRVRHFTSFYLVMMTCTDADYILNCAADIDLAEPYDWISSAIEKLEDNLWYIVANPAWGWDIDGARNEALEEDPPYFVSQAFSDACFLGKRAIFAQPIYNYRHASGKHYPLSHVGEVFEQRVGAFMRIRGYFRLTDSRAVYDHHGVLGGAYPSPSRLQKLKIRIQRYIGLN